MAKKKRRGFSFKFGKFQASFSNRWVYTFVAVFVLALLGVFVYALGSVPNPGHAVSELQTCDNNGEILKMSGGSWTCATDDSGSGGSSLWSSSGSDVYYNGGNVGIGTSSPANLLHSAGTIRADGNYLLHSSDGNSAGYIGTNGETGAQNGIRIVSNRGSGEIEFWTNDATTQEEVSIENDGTLDLHGNDIVNIGDMDVVGNLIVKGTIDGKLQGASSTKVTGELHLATNRVNCAWDSGTSTCNEPVITSLDYPDCPANSFSGGIGSKQYDDECSIYDGTSELPCEGFEPIEAYRACLIVEPV